MRKDGRKILITGVSGLLGNSLAYSFKEKNKVLGLYNSHPVTIDGAQTQKGDIASKSSIDGIIKRFKPDVLIHCASLTDVDFCELNKELTDNVNVFGTKVVRDSIGASRTKLIYISTDSVFDGVKGNFSEEDNVNPTNYYGMSKYKGEQEVLKRQGSLILRTNLFGWNIQNKFSLAEWILHELLHKREIKGFKDVYFSSLYTFELAEILERVIAKDLTGIYNCASATSLSKYDFAMRIADKFDLDKSLIKPISVDDFHFKAKRGKNLTLNVSKLTTDLGYVLPTIDKSIESFYRHSGKGFFREAMQESASLRVSSESKFIPYGRQCIEEDDINAVVNVLRSERITQGPKIEEFEDALCKYTGAGYAVAVSNGTTALHIASLAAGIGKDDEAITTPMTFAASANCVLYCGARPVFSDTQEDTVNIDPGEVEKKVTRKTKMVIPVHFAGHPCDLEEVRKISKRYNLIVCEDAAHALGAEYKGSKIGSCDYSDMAVFSFHPVKSITTGEGGAILTNRHDLYEKLLMLRNHGITKNRKKFLTSEPQTSAFGSWYYEMQEVGFNYRITDLQCALGISQLKKLDRFLERRREIADIYKQRLSGVDEIVLPEEKPYVKSSWHLYYVRFKNAAKRQEVFEKLQKSSIGVQVHYIPVHLHPYYRNNFGYKAGDYPKAEKYYANTITLPLYPGMSDKNVEYVVKALKESL